MAGDQLHVVVLPWSAFGHMLPFFKLSIELASAGIHVSYVSTPRNIERLPKVPQHLASLMNLVALPLPKLDKEDLLPEGAEATVDIPFPKYQYLKTAYDLLQHPFEKFLADQCPDWVIIDVMPHWVVEIARKHRVKLMFFSVFKATTAAFLGPPKYLFGEGRTQARPSPESLMSSPEWVDFPSSIAFKKFEAIDNFAALYTIPDGFVLSEAERIGKIMKACQALTIRSSNECESNYLDLLRKIHGKPVLPAGLLAPEKPEGRGKIDGSWEPIFKWLDEQKPKSVVYVGFGSEVKFSKEQTYEMAYGLELSDVPFLWALRKPEWAKDELDALPPGFGERTKGKGVVSFGWAPQMQILGHPSIGGSLFHCGWSSVIESLQFGHCLVGLPFMIDQGLIARWLVEKGLGVEIDRGEDGSFSRDDIAKALRVAMVLEEGEGLRVRAREAAAIYGDKKLQKDYIGGLVEFLKNGNQI
ncbi:UDP-glycosyltransferase [Quillaja saponaria]|uniref:UDP-glycosyltransferase n=1 Tax=Quillaja saponaria TaxID=32244 RepID=A0AAD7LQU5_QUISA|nr:UDP-glycosyltransferase [Quillaja saponaria]